MKLNGLVGKGTGKLGASVFAVRKGVQIVREYNDKVGNPNTRPQVVQRAKFKLLTQLAAIIGNKGMLYNVVNPGASMRNIFLKKNMSAVEVLPGANVATLKIDELTLTDGSFLFSAPEYNTQLNNVSIDLSDTSLEDVAGAAIIVITQPEMGRVLGYSQKVLREEGAGNITVDIVVPAPMVNKTAVLVWLYRFKDAAARARYEQTIATNDTTLSLVFNRMVAEGDIEVSATMMATKTQG